MTTKTKAIRALNDELRQNLATGTALMTGSVASLGAETVARIVKTFAVSLLGGWAGGIGYFPSTSILLAAVWIEAGFCSWRRRRASTKYTYSPERLHGYGRDNPPA
jgi:hypothetical protein